MNVTVCREGAWTELTIRVTPVVAVQSETHGLNIKFIGRRKQTLFCGVFYISMISSLNFSYFSIIMKFSLARHSPLYYN